MNFLLACRWFFPSDQGGVAMHNGYLIKAIKNSCNAQVLSLQNESNADFYRREGIIFFSVSEPQLKWIKEVCKFNWMKNALRSYYDWLVSKRMAKEVERIQPDVVEFMDIHSEGYVYLKRNRKRKTKVVIRSHTPWGLLRTTYKPQDIKGVDGWWAKERERFCFHACDAITTPSYDLKRQLMKLYSIPDNKITVIPNIIDTEHFHPAERRYHNEYFTFLHVGRFERAKGVITMIKGFVEIAKRYPNVRLINVGKARGDAFTICKQLLEDNGLLDNVEFTGFVSYEDLPVYYAKADAVIVPPEIYESFSYTVAQAMACGKYVIASNSGGIPETVDSDAYVFELKNVSTLIKCMDAVIQDRGKGGLKVNYKAIEKSCQFSIQSLREVYLPLYQNLVHA